MPSARDIIYFDHWHPANAVAGQLLQCCVQGIVRIGKKHVTVHRTLDHLPRSFGERYMPDVGKREHPQEIPVWIKHDRSIQPTFSEQILRLSHGLLWRN